MQSHIQLCFRCNFPALETIKRFEKGDLLHAGIHVLRGSLSFKSRKKTKENRKGWWGRDIKNKKGEGRNVKTFQMTFLSLHNTVDSQVHSLELLEMLNTNNALLSRVLEMKGIKIAPGI